jgi:AraC family transcriptional regulator, L-rhamnose operon transcriptional activator RhaR
MNSEQNSFRIFTGENFFRAGESIYINKAYEEAESHMHSHDFIEIAYVASGTGTHKIGNMEYSVSKGDLFIINHDIPHEFRSLPDRSKSKLMIYNCIFKPEFFDYQLINSKDFQDITHHFLFRLLFPDEDKMPGDIVLLGKDCAELEQLYIKMYNEYNNQDTGYIEILRAYVIELLVLIVRLFKNIKDSKSSLNHHRRQIIENAMKYMMDNYDRDIRLEDLSMMSFFSRNYFCRLFKETTGITVSEYIQKIRIQEACKLLIGTDRSILEISGLVGYNDIKFFNDVFKRNTGITPTAYKKKSF